MKYRVKILVKLDNKIQEKYISLYPSNCKLSCHCGQGHIFDNQIDCYSLSVARWKYNQIMRGVYKYWSCPKIVRS